MNISALIVVYNESIGDIACLEELIKSEIVGQIVICDNSTVENDNERMAADLGIVYLPMGGNKGLSVAYNAGVAVCTGDAVCIFDDDTQIVPGYFGELAHAWASERNWDLAVSLVFAGDEVISPVYFNGYRAKPVTEIRGNIESKSLTGINSGMVVKRRVFDSIRYDEKLFLDLVDHRFCQDALEAGFDISFFPNMILRQNYSYATDSAKQAANRFSVFRKDAKMFYGGDFAHRAYCAAMLAYRKAKLVKKYGMDFFKASSSAGCRP